MVPENEQPAADALEQGGESDSSFYLPKFPGSENLKPGDTVSLKVVSNDEDGVAVEPISEADEESSENDGGMMENFDNEVS